MSQQISTTGDLQVLQTSATGNLEIEGVPELERTSAAADHTEIIESLERIFGRTDIKGTSAAAEHTEIIERILEIEGVPELERTSAAADHTEIIESLERIFGRTDIKGTSAAAEHTEIIERILEIEGVPELERTSAAADHTEIIESLERIFGRTDIKGTSAAAEHTEIIERILETKGVPGRTDINGTSATAEHTESKERIHWPQNSIFRVPQHLTYCTSFRFAPKLVSIGPYFLGEQQLERMENLKTKCNEEILKMLGIALTKTNHLKPPESPNKLNPPRKAINLFDPLISQSLFAEPSVWKLMPHEDMETDSELFQQFKDSGRKARAYYKEPFALTDVKFVTMLFFDSCFIIRTIFAFSQKTQSMSFLDVHIKEVRSDLLLLDNQIPLFFIKEVYEWFLNKLEDKNLPDFNTVLEPFICLDMPWAINQDAKYSDATHLLDLYWRYSLPPQMYRELTSSESYHWEMERGLSNSSEIDPSKKALMVIANATELQQNAGIEFEKFKDESHLAVTFSKNFFKGIIGMPRLKIDSRQMTLLTNLIVFENCIVPRMRTISCYMKLMNALINSEKDVELLQNSGVIYNTLSSHEMAATLFNDIGDFCFTDDKKNLFSDLYKDVQKYYDSAWHRRLASLRHNYFNSPWAGISVFAALILLGLSVVQTFYSVYGYYKPNN